MEVSELIDETVLFRQVSNGWRKPGTNEITRQAYTPTENHNFVISTDRGDMVTAEESWSAFNVSNKSVAVIQLLVRDYRNETLKPKHDSIDRESHVSVDTKSLGKKKRKEVARRLLRTSQEYGVQYTADGFIETEDFVIQQQLPLGD